MVASSRAPKRTARCNVLGLRVCLPLSLNASARSWQRRATQAPDRARNAPGRVQSARACLCAGLAIQQGARGLRATRDAQRSDAAGWGGARLSAELSDPRFSSTTQRAHGARLAA